ncbi:MAG: hypothetical protein PHW07_02650 [Sulfurospirillaceae bacterium]|nr:hypothetical protein [Sulfurospirillaceae bacterium]
MCCNKFRFIFLIGMVGISYLLSRYFSTMVVASFVAVVFIGVTIWKFTSVDEKTDD